MRLADGVVELRPFTMRMVDRRYLNWFSDPDITRFIANRPKDLAEARQYARDKLLDTNCRFFSIYALGARVGTLKLDRDKTDPEDWWVGVMIAEAVWRGCGIGPRALWLGCLYAFDRLRARKVYAGIDHANKASVRAFEKAGFRFTQDPDRIVAWKTS